MTYIPTQTGFMNLKDSQISYEPSSQSIPVWNRAIPRQLWNWFFRGAQIGASTVFSITVESCRRFSLREILIMAAMNKADRVRTASGRVRSNAAVAARA